MAEEALMVLPASALLTVAEKRANAIAAERAAAAKAAEEARVEAPPTVHLPKWWPGCPRCNRPVDRLEFTCDPGSHHVRVSIVCHGAPGQPIRWGAPR